MIGKERREQVKTTFFTKNGVKSFGNQEVDFPNERHEKTLNTGGHNPLERNLWCNYFKIKGLKH